MIDDDRIDLVSFSELTPNSAREMAASRIGEELCYSLIDPQRGSHGTGLDSRYPLRRLRAPGTAGNDLPTIRAAAKLPGGIVADVYSIHPFAPLGAGAVEQLTKYLQAIPSAPEAGPPTLLIGDFNATLDSARLRDVIDRGFVDAADAAGSGLQWTWPRSLRPPPVTIDHVIAATGSRSSTLPPPRSTAPTTERCWPP